MRIGVVIEETWSFFREIYEELASHHQTTLFQHESINLPIFHDRINNLKFNRDLARYLRTNDVVFFEWASELLALATQLPKACIIVTRAHRYELYHWADKVNWAAVDRIILVSEAKRREFSKRFQDHAGKVVVIPEAIDLGNFEHIDKPFAGDIGILCHLTPRKRVYELILAFYELTRRQSNFTLHIGGGRHERFGDYYEALHRLVSKLGIEENVRFYGNINDPKEWYANIDIFISNSYSEGLQVAPMEAIASGCYCLSHHWDGADELLPDKYLFLTEQELIKKIQEFADSAPDERFVLKEHQRNHVIQHFNMEEIKVRVREVIEGVVKDTPG